MDKSNEFSTEHLVQPPGAILPSTGPEFKPGRVQERRQRLAEQYAEMQQKKTDGFEDPLAVKVGPHAEDIPAGGWPEEFKPGVVKRILGYLAKAEEE